MARSREQSTRPPPSPRHHHERADPNVPLIEGYRPRTDWLIASSIHGAARRAPIDGGPHSNRASTRRRLVRCDRGRSGPNERGWVHRSWVGHVCRPSGSIERPNDVHRKMGKGVFASYVASKKQTNKKQANKNKRTVHGPQPISIFAI